MDAVVLVIASSSTGTGFFINKSGCLLTAGHVVMKKNGTEKNLHILVHGDFKPRKAWVIIANDMLDMAMVCSEVKPPHVLKIVGTESINRGDRVYALGHTAGRMWNLTEGVVSRMGYKLHRGSMKGWWMPKYDLWITTFISWGNSGGPIVNSHGDVVGMLVEWDDPAGAGHPNGMNIAIPGTDLLRFIRTMEGN
jgi:S1-C subfamily serine protease